MILFIQNIAMYKFIIRSVKNIFQAIDVGHPSDSFVSINTFLVSSSTTINTSVPKYLKEIKVFGNQVRQAKSIHFSQVRTNEIQVKILFLNFNLFPNYTVHSFKSNLDLTSNSKLQPIFISG